MSLPVYDRNGEEVGSYDIDPAELPLLKRRSNDWETEYRDSHPHPEARPLNLDPGYLTEAKLVLATTKDRDHRIYLSQG